MTVCQEDWYLQPSGLSSQTRACEHQSQPSKPHTDPPHYQLGLSYFHTKEFKRCAFALTDYDDPKSVFLRNYALFLSLGEMFEDRIKVNQQQILQITQELEEYEQKDGFHFYLLGILYKNLKQKEKAIESVLESVKRYPLNWSAWTDLATLLDSPELYQRVLPSLPDHFMTNFFRIHLLNEMPHDQDSLASLIDEMQQLFPDSKYLLLQKCIMYHNARDFEEAQMHFDELYKRDPYMIEGTDAYSNVLYVKNDYAKLCHLAQHVATLDQFRPETCLVLGNYYSARSERSKAVESFGRAVKLDPHYAPAWTLMGHEYVELGNAQAAIEVYRKAVEINPRDYRAWFGLGQAHDLMRLFNYSLYYYQKAVALRPYDDRLWNALSSCFQSLNQPLQAIKCLKRSLTVSDAIEPKVYAKIAKLYLTLPETEPNLETVAYFYKKYLQEHQIVSQVTLATWRVFRRSQSVPG
ncbi:hypothetical protein EDD86DRAFT_188786 [Gorgonomyces haynaldii]|nr:hypothetical protein EDD86DRAFT_188786 [Gorgonomyces haynaldii]